MYVGRILEQLQDLPFEKWTIEELAYHQDTLSQFRSCLNQRGLTVFEGVEAEVKKRGGLTSCDVGYEHTSQVRYD